MREWFLQRRLVQRLRAGLRWGVTVCLCAGLLCAAQTGAQEPPAAAQPATEQPAPEQPAAEQPAAEQPAAEQLAEPLPERLYERLPYDEIVLKDAAHTVVPVEVISSEQMPVRRMPPAEEIKPNQKLIVRKIEDPTQDYEVLWKDIAEIRFFEQLVLQEALSKVRAKEFDQAYDYFAWLIARYPSMDGLDEGRQTYLYEEAKERQRQGDAPTALLLLYELYNRNPDYGGLSNALGLVTGKLVEQRVAAGEFISARRLIRALEQRYPAHGVVGEYRELLIQRAREALAQAESAQAAGDQRRAQELGLQALAIWPPLPEARSFLEVAFREYPIITVGVGEVGPPAGDWFSWGGRRQRRLLERTLCEYRGTGPEGGEYDSPLCRELRVEDLGRQLVLELKPELVWPGGGPVTGYDLARRLLHLADPARPDYLPVWAEILGAVEVEDVYTVRISFRTSFVQPKALLQTGLASAADGAALVGPYRLAPPPSGVEAVRFVAQTDVFDALAAGQAAGRPREIVELRFAESARALQALQAGQIQVLDRVNPWELDRVRSLKSVGVDLVPYSVPTIHCILPNTSKPLLANRAFRRALLYGTHREHILRKLLFKGRPAAGAAVLSAPFPRATLGGEGEAAAAAPSDSPAAAAGASESGSSEAVNSDLGYGYDERIEPRPFDARLAMTLASVARVQLNKAAEKRGEPQLTELPPLTLAHPPNEIARLVCQAIQKQWAIWGVKLNLRELAPGEPPRLDDQTDLLFLELSVTEPVTDARRLLGADGLAGQCSPHMALALRQLDEATGWLQVRETLRRVHRIAHEDATLLPLWQYVDHFAVHSSLQMPRQRPSESGGAAQDKETPRHIVPPVLYDAVEDWRAVLALPPGETE